MKELGRGIWAGAGGKYLLFGTVQVVVYSLLYVLATYL